MFHKASTRLLTLAKSLPDKIIAKISDYHSENIFSSCISSKNVIAFYGMRRSGNHAVAEWLLRCLSQTDDRIIVKLNLVACGNSCYVNAINQYFNSIEMRTDIQFAGLTYQNILVTHEDVDSNFPAKYTQGLKKIVVIRDIRDLVASRLKSMNKCLRKNQHFFQIDDTFFSNWLEHASPKTNTEKTLIKFENWAKSTDYREQICKELGIKNFDGFSPITHHGGGSSFSGKGVVPTYSELSNRRYQIQIPDHIQDRINSQDIKNALERLGYL